MMFRPKKNRRGFTLLELAIVVGMFASLLGGLWSLAAIARQKMRVAQTLDAIAYTADSMRSVYASQAYIIAGYSTLVPTLVQDDGIIKSFVNSASPAPSCSGYTPFASAPWSVNSGACDTFRACYWNYKATGGTTACASAASATGYQFFAVEIVQLDYGSCVTLASGVYPTHPPGLADVYINGTGAVAGASQALPVPVSWASGKCSSSSVNTVDFVYRLRVPVS